MDIRRLDLDIAIYRDRVQVTDRSTSSFVDQRAEYPFSSNHSLVANPRNLEDTLVRAIRQLLSGGFMLSKPSARVIASELPLSPSQKTIVETALREAGISDVTFAL
ncbi:hypothetical protein [Erythrobacter sp.]|uniref:hypothetical protein n=1 Tax=Erythrobacter sp. TaxID=1042 RepID=UPI00311FBD7F